MAATEKKYLAEKEVFEKAQQEFRRHKSGLEAEVKARADERQALQTKRTKIAARIAKVDDELARIADANSRGPRRGRAPPPADGRVQAGALETRQNLTDRLQSLRTLNAAKQEQVGSPSPAAQ